MKVNINIALMVISVSVSLCFFTQPAIAHQTLKLPLNASHSKEIEVSGLLLVNTISRQGHEFARQFSVYWQDIPNTAGLNIQIKEILLPSAGTRLTVNVFNRPVYNTFMGRRQSPVKDKVEQAVLIVINAMASASDQSNSPDLAEDEW